jgi:hypothetical protein
LEAKVEEFASSLAQSSEQFAVAQATQLRDVFFGLGH